MDLGLVVKEQSHYLEIYIDNKNEGNSFGLSEAEDLLEWISSAKDIVWRTASHQSFCSGGNLKQYASQPPHVGRAINVKIREALGQLYQHSHKTIAIVSGFCLGGGMELLSCFDKVVATPSAIFGLWHRRIGVSYGWGGGQRLAKRISLHRLKDLSLSARSFSAYEALEFGFVDLVCSEKKSLESAYNLLEENSLLPKEPFRAMKQFSPLSEVEDFEKIWMNPSHKKSLESF